MNTVASQTVRVQLKWCQDKLEPIRLPTGAQHTIVLCRPILRRIELGALVYAAGATLPFGPLLSPIAFEHALATLTKWPMHATNEPGLHLAAIGHTSCDGPTDLNARLSESRAQIAMAMALNDVDSWLDATKGKIPDIDLAAIYMWNARLQGRNEYFRDPTQPTHAELVRACRSFQEHYIGQRAQRVNVDGKCGEATLGAMFERIQTSLNSYREQLGVDIDLVRALPRFSVSGVGTRYVESSNCTPRLDVHQLGRVVDLLLVDPESLSMCSDLPLEQMYRGKDVRRISYPSARPILRAIKVRLHDHLATPMLHTRCELYIDREKQHGSSDHEGFVEFMLPEACPEFAILAWGKNENNGSYRYRQRINITCRPGANLDDWRACLHNLGYGDFELDEATKSFQRDYEVDDTPTPLGLIDQQSPPPASLAKLESIFFAKQGNAERTRTATKEQIGG